MSSQYNILAKVSRNYCTNSVSCEYNHVISIEFALKLPWNFRRNFVEISTKFRWSHRSFIEVSSKFRRSSVVCSSNFRRSFVTVVSKFGRNCVEAVSKLSGFVEVLSKWSGLSKFRRSFVEVSSNALEHEGYHRFAT